MLPMSVTLEVSKLSGWLNASANCRESNGGRTMWGEVQSTGRPEVAGDRGPRGVWRAGEGSSAHWEQGTGRSAR